LNPTIIERSFKHGLSTPKVDRETVDGLTTTLRFHTAPTAFLAKTYSPAVRIVYTTFTNEYVLLIAGTSEVTELVAFEIETGCNILNILVGFPKASTAPTTTMTGCPATPQ
jgi:hypothetical protein